MKTGEKTLRQRLLHQPRAQLRSGFATVGIVRKTQIRTIEKVYLSALLSHYLNPLATGVLR